ARRANPPGGPLARPRARARAAARPRAADGERVPLHDDLDVLAPQAGEVDRDEHLGVALPDRYRRDPARPRLGPEPHLAQQLDEAAHLLLDVLRWVLLRGERGVGRGAPGGGASPRRP